MFARCECATDLLAELGRVCRYTRHNCSLVKGRRDLGVFAGLRISPCFEGLHCGAESEPTNILCLSVCLCLCLCLSFSLSLSLSLCLSVSLSVCLSLSVSISLPLSHSLLSLSYLFQYICLLFFSSLFRSGLICVYLQAQNMVLN